ncbi:type VI secretion system Vgr family protein [Rubrivirga sp. IMCC45206]|uniref:type VI secretion system Vgr family protein n=1 Tax=Rubrivirga sp. IMCC45206 TaxID=3391614 RepID=UPI00398FE056
MPPAHRIARHEFACSALSAATFRVVGFEGVETISQPYRFEIELVSDDPEVPFEDVIDGPATLTMYRGDEPSEVGGIVVDFEQSHEAGGQSEFRYAYRAVLVPRLWRLGLSFRSRIFQNLTVEEIVTKLLDDAGVEHEWTLSGAYAPREFTTQYKETDLAFVQRLLEFEGIAYHFSHGGGTETLVLTDDASTAKPIDGDDTIPYSHADGLRPTDSLETVRDARIRQRLVTARAAIADYNYRTPAADLTGEAEGGDGPALGVHSDSAIHVGDGDRSNALAKVRLEEIETTRRVLHGTGDCLRFRTGFRFTLADHFRPDLNQGYLITEVHHLGRQPDAQEAASADDVRPGYSNTFRAVPAGVPYRPPRRTPEPKLPGVLTATVESAGGTYAPVDDQGRYRVRFPFDLGDAGAAQATKPVRLAQPYTGPGYGQHFPVHKDAEMVVACVDGNVDRIVGLSTVYNPAQYSPVTSSNAAHNVMRSWGENELTFDDTQGAELVFMHATKDHHCEVVDNQLNTVGTNRRQTVGQDEQMSVGRDQAEDVGRDKTFTVGQNETITVGVDRSLAVGANLSESVGGSMSLTVGTTKTETVAIASTLSVGAAYSVSVGATKSESVGASSSETVGAAKSVDVGGNYSVAVGAATTLETATDYDVSAGQNGSLTFGDDGVVQIGKDLTLKAGKKALIEAADQLTIKCGKAELVMKKNGDISIKGKKLDLKASGKMTLKGSQIAEN